MRIRFFFEREKTDKQDFISEIFNSSKKAVVFKLMYGQFQRWQLGQDLIRTQTPIIHLIRKNKIKHTISLVTAGGIKNKPLNITPHQLLKSVIDLEEKDQHFQQYISNCSKKSIQLFYEDIVGENDEDLTYLNDDTARKICGFLKIDKKPMTSRTKKKRSENIWKYLDNKEKIIELFKNNKRLHYLEGNM